MPVYDVRDYNFSAPTGIHTFGGFIGELVISLCSMQETMTSRMDMPGFEINRAQVLGFLEELLLEGYPADICTVRLTEYPLSVEEQQKGDKEEQALKIGQRLALGKSLAQFGLQFFL